MGYSLATAFGYAYNNKRNLLIPCIIGDGEAETGTIAASWYLNKIFQREKSSLVIPIVNLNNYKMGSKSLFSMFTKSQLNEYFKALNYVVYNVDENIENFQEVLENIKYKFIDNKINKYPIIILNTKKGWTGYNSDIIKIEDTVISHKNPLNKIDNITQRIEILNKWLNSYKFNELFDKENGIKNEILNIVPNIKRDYKILKNLNRIEGEKFKFKYLDIDSNIKGVLDFIKFNNIDKNFLIVSPDEIYSNKLEDAINEVSVIEILNENICQALYQGYIRSGRNGMYISYEGFMCIISSMVTQYMKFIYQNKKININKKYNSLNYILTSVCWENNYSHQNPGFINTILNNELLENNIIFPRTDIICLKVCKSIIIKKMLLMFL